MTGLQKFLIACGVVASLWVVTTVMLVVLGQIYA